MPRPDCCPLYYLYCPPPVSLHVPFPLCLLLVYFCCLGPFAAPFGSPLLSPNLGCPLDSAAPLFLLPFRIPYRCLLISDVCPPRAALFVSAARALLLPGLLLLTSAASLILLPLYVCCPVILVASPRLLPSYPRLTSAAVSLCRFLYACCSLISIASAHLLPPPDPRCCLLTSVALLALLPRYFCCLFPTAAPLSLMSALPVPFPLCLLLAYCCCLASSS